MERAVLAGTVVVAAAAGAAWLAWGAERPELPPAPSEATPPRSAAALEGPTGVIMHDAVRSAPGANLVLSGHAPRAVLLDMDGAELQRWSAAWPDAKKAV